MDSNEQDTPRATPDGPLREEDSGALPVRSIPEKVAQAHGGAIYAGGVPGHRGGNQHTVARSEQLRAAAQDILEDLTDELRLYLKKAREQSGRCKRCGAFTEKVPPLNIDRTMALYDRLAKYAIGTNVMEHGGGGGVVITTMGNTCVKHGAILVCPKCIAG